jgi:large subunit ribosomal protein L9
MKVILKEKIEGMGEAFSVQNVKPGHARNYLLPMGKAIVATPGNLKRLEIEKARYEKRLARIMKTLEEKAAKLTALSLTISVKTGENDQMYGSVTNKQIAEKIQQEGVDLDKKFIDLPDPIRALGVYDIPVKLGLPQNPTIKVWVVKELAE